jgi:hypothetical protein
MIKEQQKKLILPKGVFIIKYTLETYPPIYVLSNGKKIKGILKKKSRSRKKSRSKKRSRKRMNDGYIINVNQNYVPFGCKVPKAFI